MARNLREEPHCLTEEQLSHLISEMRDSFRTAEHADEECDRWLPMVPSQVHPKDHHVVAAALAAECKVIVTTNLRDFARRDLPGLIGIEVKPPDEFLVDQWNLNPRRVAPGVRRQIARLGRTPEEHVALVARRLPQYGAELQDSIELLRET